jgi:HAMP domain-containing protein
MEKTIEQSLEELNKALEANQNVVKAPPYKVDDHTKDAEKYLSAKAQEAMKEKAKNLMILKDGKIISRCVYFSAVVAKNNVDAGIQKMAEIANRLAEKEYITSVLTPISALSLAILPGELHKSVVFFFPHIKIDNVEEVEKMEYSTKEGGIGPTIGDTTLVLPAGEFWAEARILHDLALMRYSPGYDIDGRLFGLVQEYLNVLPPGTKFLGANKCSVYDLSIPFELRFSNPLLDKVRNVELEYKRAAAAVDDKLIQGNLLMGIKYFDAKGKRLYK